MPPLGLGSCTVQLLLSEPEGSNAHVERVTQEAAPERAVVVGRAAGGAEAAGADPLDHRLHPLPAGAAKKFHKLVVCPFLGLFGQTCRIAKILIPYHLPF